MSSTLDKMVPVFTGSNWQQWHTSMQAYLRAQGQWFVYGTEKPASDHETWDEHNEKALSNITLRVSPSIQVAISHLDTVKEVWDHLKANYGSHHIGPAYAKLSPLLATYTPPRAHPPPALPKTLPHHTHLDDDPLDLPARLPAQL